MRTKSSLGTKQQHEKRPPCVERVAYRDRGVRSEVKELTTSVQHQEEQEADIRELARQFERAKAGA